MQEGADESRWGSVWGMLEGADESSWGSVRGILGVEIEEGCKWGDEWEMRGERKDMHGGIQIINEVDIAPPHSGPCGSVHCADLNLYPAKEWKEQGWDWCDSMDPQRELDGYSDADVPDPEKGQEG